MQTLKLRTGPSKFQHLLENYSMAIPETLVSNVTITSNLLDEVSNISIEVHYMQLKQNDPSVFGRRASSLVEYVKNPYENIIQKTKELKIELEDDFLCNAILVFCEPIEREITVEFIISR